MSSNLSSTLTPELLDGLAPRIENTLVDLIKKNRHTRYVSESPVFAEFRAALDALDDADDRLLLDCFRTSVPMTAYDSYEPFAQRLLTPNAREQDVVDMFSPGLPYFLAGSSGTSGKKTKLFAKYRHVSRSSLHDVDEHANPVSEHGGKNCVVYSLTYSQIINVVGDDGSAVGQYPVTSLSSGVIRMQHGMDIDKDPWFITLTAPRATSPVAVSFIVNYRSFLLMHALFALADSQLENINTLFGPVFVDMIHYMEEEWDLLVQSIDTGVLPDWEGTSHVRQHLEPKFPARPERAAHLRAVGKSTEEVGWLKRLWPGLNVVIGIASGVFSAVIPKVRHYIGPDVHMSSLGFTASEAYIGTAFSATDLSLFKATNDDIIEYLDFAKAETPSNLYLGHEVEVGHRYEIVVTARDGLWRYRLGDVVEIAGFDSTDGTPILRYVERRGTFARVPSTLISEEELARAISSAQDVLGPIPEFTVIVDDRKAPTSLAFFVEIDDALSTSADQAPARIEATLCDGSNNVRKLLALGKLASPTVQILKAGTFREYRGLKVKAAITGAGQVKVPAVLSDPETQEWMWQRVEREITHPTS